MIKNCLLPLVGSLLIFSCAGKNDKQQKIETEDSLTAKKVSDIPSFYIVTGDSLELPPFDVTLALTPEAEKLLKKEKEKITVAAWFYGIPKDTLMEEYLESGQFQVAVADKELKKDRSAHFAGIKISKARYDSLSDNNLQLLINVFSSRSYLNGNLLDAEAVDEKISNIRGKNFTIVVKAVPQEE
jgi:hypothetical protein